MLVFLWVDGLVRRRWVRLGGMTVCVALAVALFASLGAFITFSNARMTQQAISGVPVDWQVELAPGTNVAAATKTILTAENVQMLREVGFANVRGITATTGATVQTTGAGKAVGLPADYASRFPGEIRYLTGAKSGVLLAQQTAANLHVAVGDPVSMQLPGGASMTVRVDGIVDLPAADSLFQVVGAPPGSGATAPPDNVVLLPLDRWHALFDPIGTTSPEKVRTQLHLKLSHGLPANPSAAYNAVVTSAHNLEAKLAGTGAVGNNLAAILDAARKDAVYSQLLFLFLGLPGIVLASLLTTVAGASGHERRRREQALLRTRGASPARIVRLAAAEAALVGCLGIVLGLATAYITDRSMLSASLGGSPAPVLLLWAIAASVLALLLAGWAIVLPAQRDASELTVRAEAAQIGVLKSPLWARLYVDVALLGGSGLIYWQSMKDAYQVVLVPEGVPSISINYLTLLAPMMFWIGGALLSWRIGDMVLRRRGGLKAAVRPVAGRLSGTVAAGMSRQRQLLARSLVLTALAVSFAMSVAIFNTTYSAQARVDAELTNGADVAVTSGPAGLPPSLITAVAGLRGVTAVQPMQHRLGYVGNDLQDLFGIDPATIAQATPMSDAYFQGGTAKQLLATLKSHPDGLLVSDETVKDFELQPGDTIKIRLQSASDHQYHEVPFHYVGVAREFPTAPHDSFLVANSDYVAKMTGSPSFETLLVRTSQSPAVVAASVRSLIGPTGGTVTDVNTELKATLSGLTAIDLSGLTRLELAFAVIMAVMASGLMLVLGFAERRRSFAIVHALGARPNQLAGFVWSEAVFVTAGGAILGGISGWLEAVMIVRILTGVFDPPPDTLSVPWAYLGTVAAAILISVIVAGVADIAIARRPALEVIRDL
jgi:putative ABC transport system permease protein